MNRIWMAPVSPGDLLDRITILLIKTEKITDPRKNLLVWTELSMLEVVARPLLSRDDLCDHIEALREVNRLLWDVEEAVRDHVRREDFGERYITWTKQVPTGNDRRALIKREINSIVGSQVVEVKSHRDA